MRIASSAGWRKRPSLLRLLVLLLMAAGSKRRRHSKTRQLRGSEGRGYRDVGCVPPAGHHDTSDTGMVMAGLESVTMPAAGKIQPSPGSPRSRVTPDAADSRKTQAIAGGD